MTSIISFITVVYMARNITQEEMGVIGLFMAVLFISPQLISFSATNLISINKVNLLENEYKNFTNSFITFSIIIFLLLCLLSFMFFIFFNNYWQLFLLIPILSFLMNLSLIHQLELVQDGKSKVYGNYSLFSVITTSIITIITIELLGLSWDGRLLSMMIGQFILLVVMWNFSFKTLKRFNFDFNKKSFKDFIYFGFPLFLGLGAGWLLNQADNYIVLHYFTLADVGIYSVAYSIGLLVNRINQATTSAIMPTFYTALHKGEGHKVINKFYIYYGVAIFLISLLVGGLSYWYMPIIFGYNYASSADIVFFISLAFAFFGIYSISEKVISYHKENKLKMYLLYISALANIVLSISLIPEFGILAPAIGTLFGFVLLAITSFYFSKQILIKKEVDKI